MTQRRRYAWCSPERCGGMGCGSRLFQATNRRNGAPRPLHPTSAKCNGRTAIQRWQRKTSRSTGSIAQYPLRTRWRSVTDEAMRSQWNERRAEVLAQRRSLISIRDDERWREKRWDILPCDDERHGRSDEISSIRDDERWLDPTFSLLWLLLPLAVDLIAAQYQPSKPQQLQVSSPHLPDYKHMTKFS